MVGSALSSFLQCFDTAGRVTRTASIQTCKRLVPSICKDSLPKQAEEYQAETGSSSGKENTWCQRLRRLQHSRRELSAGRTPSFVAVCCNVSVCQALETLLVLVPEPAHLSTFYFALNK